MATEKFANNPSTTLNGAITAGAISLIVNSAASFPNNGQFRILIDNELILVGSVAGSTFSNLTRGIENTTPATHGNGATVTLILTAGSLARNPRSMANTGDIEYLDATGAPVALAAPADGAYNISFASGVPSYSSSGSVAEITGAIKMWPGSSAPTGYLLCDGSAISRTTYSALFAIMGTTYGAGNGSTTFNLPDLRQRFPLGKAASGTGSTLGSSGGSIDHTHTGPLHSHTAPSHTHTIPTAGTFGRVSDGTFSWKDPNNPGYLFITGNIGAGSPTIDNAVSAGANAVTAAGGNSATSSDGNGATGSNNPPYVVVNYIIKT